MIRLMVPEIGEDEVRAVAEVLRSGFLVQGPLVRRFEQLVADSVGVRHAVAVSSGTEALRLALLALGVGPGDEVLVPDFTFPACGNVVESLGAAAVLVDVEPDTFNVDPRRLAEAVTPRTRVLMPVHLFGLPADMDAVGAVAAAHGLPVVEDAACALGAAWKGRPCGSIGRLGCFSFHPRKVVTTGEGGMVVTDDDELAESLRILRNHGQVSVDGSVSFARVGDNGRLTEMQGALGVVQMGRLTSGRERRRTVAGWYREELGGRPRLQLPVEPPESVHAWQAYVVLLAADVDRAAVQRGLRERGIETAIGTYALSAQPAFRHRSADCPVSLQAYRRTLALPFHASLTRDEVREVAAALRDLVGPHGG